jgi:prepilin-type processing-associated H-X9-DG protein
MKSELMRTPRGLRTRCGGQRPRLGFTRLELAAVLAIMGMIAAWLMVVGERSRRTAMLGEDLSNLRQIATLTGQYAADNDDKFWTFSWQGGETYNTKWPDLNFASSDAQAGASQGVVILRDYVGRLEMPQMSAWYAYYMYSHLPLMQYAGRGVPSRVFVPSGDQPRLLWSTDPEGFDQGKFGPNQPAPSPINKRWPYSSSYQLASSFFDQSPAGQRISQGGVENLYSIPTDHDLRARALSSTAFPSNKVLLHDKYAWHFGTSTKHNKPTFPLAQGYAFFGDDDARLPLLFVDGHVAVHTSGEGNKGWQLNGLSPCKSVTT